MKKNKSIPKGFAEIKNLGPRAAKMEVKLRINESIKES